MNWLYNPKHKTVEESSEEFGVVSEIAASLIEKKRVMLGNAR